MKVCAACRQEHPKEGFSKKQWQLKQYQRRCKECVAANRAVQLEAAPRSEEVAAENEGPSCWICLETAGEDGPLLRDCSCRGDSAGFAHFLCLVAYAEQKCHDNLSNKEGMMVTPWTECPNCCQYYQHELAIDLATEYIRFAEKKYKFATNYGWIHLEAYIHNLQVLVTYAGRNPKQIMECKKIAKKCFSMINKLRLRLERGQSLPGDSMTPIDSMEGKVHGLLGMVCIREKTEESAERGIEHLEKYRSIAERSGRPAVVAFVEQKLAYAKAIYQGINVEDCNPVDRHRKCYEVMVEQDGQNSHSAISQGVELARSLYKAEHCIEAERLAIKLAATSRRAHGSDHEITKAVEKVLTKSKVRLVAFWGNKEIFVARGYLDGGDKCIIHGPIKDPRKVDEETTFAVDYDRILPMRGTPVICHRLESATHLNGKIGDTREIDVDTGLIPVHFEDKRLTSELVKPSNLRILFELPDCQC